MQTSLTCSLRTDKIITSKFYLFIILFSADTQDQNSKHINPMFYNTRTCKSQAHYSRAWILEPFHQLSKASFRLREVVSSSHLEDTLFQAFSVRRFGQKNAPLIYLKFSPAETRVRFKRCLQVFLRHLFIHNPLTKKSLGVA